MIKARNRKISLLLVLAMLMTMFVGIGTANAASVEFNTLSAPQISTSSDYQDLGKVSITIPDVRTLDEGEWLTISLPKGCEYYDVDSLVIEPTSNIGLTSKLQTAADTIEVLVYDNYSTGDYDGSLLIRFNDIQVRSGSGNVDAKFLSNGGTFGTMHTATIAKIGEGSTTVAAKSVKSIGDGGGYIDTILIFENSAGVFEPGEEITLKLPKGFTWYGPPVAVGAWSLLGDLFPTEMDGRTLTVTIPSNYDKPSAAGRLNIGSESTGYFYIEPDSSAKLGDVYVTVESDKKSVKQTDVLVATYGDFGVKVVEGTKEEIISGRQEQEIGEFYLEEQVAGSLVGGRSMYLELPKGVEWQYDDYGYPVIEMDTEEGSGLYGWNITPVSNSDDRKVKVNFSFDYSGNPVAFSEEATKIVFQDAEVKVKPGFEGDVTITVSGSAGAKGDVVVANAVKPVKIAAENATKVEIGAMKQKAADILITETMDEGILDGTYNRIQIDLPRGVYFAAEPTVTVESGDLEIDDVDLIDSISNQDGALLITIESASTKASVIRISDVNITVDRTVPEGKVDAKFAGADFDYDDEEDYTGSTAFVDWDNEDSIGSLVIATTITPKEGAGTVFKVGSNIYTVNGLSKVMDVAPYIKDGRTFVPMRYLGEALGAEVVWDATAKTVTLTKGATVVVFTVGSTTYTVNGESKTADVAPEIVNDRTMLPARYVAEAFGATVGWDATTSTVLIQL